MTVRKFRSEFALNLYGDFNLLLQQSDFEYLGKDNRFLPFEENPCHIYMICRRPRFAFEPDAFRITPGEIAGSIRVHLGDRFERLPFVMNDSQKRPTISVECPYPHTMGRFLNATKGGVQLKAAHLAAMNHVFLDHLALEVLYVGQSYGVDGARTAPQRLCEHSTLQGIYAAAIANSPDKEIWLLLWNFKSQWITCIDGRKHVAVTASEDEDDEHIRNVLSHVIRDQLEINLAEAGLIRYFRPEYNKVYKDSFPNPAHSTYSECYNLDLNTVNVEVNTESLASQLKSATVPAAWSHFATFPFYSPDERQAMFDLNW
jgi:hypothetical protein